MTFLELENARSVFGIGSRASLREIKARHRQLVRLHHPDTGDRPDPVVIRNVNEAYRILFEYVSGYRFSFDEDEFYEQLPDERLRRQFMDDPVWGGR